MNFLFRNMDILQRQFPNEIIGIILEFQLEKSKWNDADEVIKSQCGTINYV